MIDRLLTLLWCCSAGGRPIKLEQLKKLQTMAYQLLPDGPDDDEVGTVSQPDTTSVRGLMCMAWYSGRWTTLMGPRGTRRRRTEGRSTGKGRRLAP